MLFELYADAPKTYSLKPFCHCAPANPDFTFALEATKQLLTFIKSPARHSTQLYDKDNH